jgi:pyruvate dehydrogenase E1 component beta subunit
MPGLLVATPSTAADAKGLIKSALRGQDPVVFLMHKMLTGARGEVGGDEDLVPFGSARVARQGRDATVVAYSIMVPKSLSAAERLSADGIEVEVIDLRTVFPVDFATIEASVRRTGRLVVAGEAPRHGGVGAELAASLQEAVFDSLDGPVLRVGAAHTPIPHSPPLYEAVIPHAEDVERAVRYAVEGSRS